MPKPEDCAEFLKLSKRLESIKKKLLPISASIARSVQNHARKKFPDFTFDEKPEFSGRNVLVYGKKFTGLYDEADFELITVQYIVLEDEVKLAASIISDNYGGPEERKQYV